jgi:hypothetical protein
MSHEASRGALSDEELRYHSNDVSFFISWARITDVVGPQRDIDLAAGNVARIFNPEIADEPIPTLKTALALNYRKPLIGVSDEQIHHRVCDAWAVLEDFLRLQMEESGVSPDNIAELIGDLHRSALHSTLGLVCVPHVLGTIDKAPQPNLTPQVAA